MAMLGIDVSEHNGVIDWNKVKAGGRIKFAMIRCGYGKDMKKQDDAQFERNVREAERVGIPWGTYLYSYALNVESAKSEAQHVLRLLKGKNPQLPVAFDMEDADGYKAKNGMPSNAVLVDICDHFLSLVESKGYKVLLYASKYWLENTLNSPKLNKYPKWVAQWAKACTYAGVGPFQMWQYTSDGTVAGINGRVDMNYCYVDYLTGQKPTPVPPKPPAAEKYQVVVAVPAYYTAADAATRKNKRGTVAPGSYSVFNRGQGMINVTQTAVAPGSWINPGDNVQGAAPTAVYYTVKKGDTLSAIALWYKTTVAQLVRLNNIKNPDLIFPKQRIRVK